MLRLGNSWKNELNVKNFKRKYNIMLQTCNEKGVKSGIPVPIGSLHDLITWLTFGKRENSSLLKNFVSTNGKSILKIGNLRIFSRISQKWRLQRPPKVGSICCMRFCHPVTLAWFSIQILVISKFSKLSWNISLSITGLKSPFNS